MPTMPIESAIGIRTNASTSIASRPTRASVMPGCGPRDWLSGRLRGARLEGKENLVQVYQAGEQDHRGHEIDEGTDQDLEHVGGIAVAGDLARLDPDLP